MLSTVVIVLFVLMALCAVAGAIYAYLYFTRINPITKGHRGAGNAAASTGPIGGDPYGHRQVVRGSVDDDQAVGPSTHMFLFRKS